MEVIASAAQRIVREAGEVIASHFAAASRPDVAYKSGAADVVTEVDKATEQRLMAELSALLPGSGFFAEESASGNAGALHSLEHVWVIDPIDGTTNFVHKIPFCAVSVALYRNGEPVLGMVYNPVLRDMFFADEQGAWRNGAPMRVSQNTEMARALFATGLVSFGREDEAFFYRVLEALTSVSRGFRRLGSAALDLCYVANGAMDVYYESGINSWDVAAGAYLVRQAGGKVTDYKGSENFLHTREIVAGGPLHAEVLRVVQQHYHA